MRKRFTILTLILALVMSTVPSHAVIVQDGSGKAVEIDTFDDMSNHWAEKVANSWKYYGIIVGVKDGKNENFKPNDNITRRDFAVIMNRLFAYKTRSVNSFKDLENATYYTSAVLALNAEGIMQGSNSLFRPHDYITREEAAVTMARAFKIDAGGNNTGFYDNGRISDWAVGYVNTMAKNGYVSGYQGSFDPKGKITRAQTIQMVDNFIEGYYSTLVGGGSGFTNEYQGNGLMNSGAVRLVWSIIDGDFYMANGASGALSLENTTIDGTIKVLADKAKINLDADSKVDTIKVYLGESTIKANDNVDVIDYSLKGHILSGVPDRVRLQPGAEVTIDGVVFINDRNRSVSYVKEDLETQIAEQKGKVTGGPDIKTGTISTSSIENVINAVGNELRSSGDSDIKELGIMLNVDTDEAPTLSDYDIKIKYNGREADYKNFTVQYDKAKKNTEYTVRAYAVNDTGKAGYGQANSLWTYDVTATMSIVSTQAIKSNTITRTIDVLLYGESVPQVSKVEVLGNVRNGIDEEIEIYSAKANSSVVSEGLEKFAYTTTIDYKTDSLGFAELDNYYGYRITFRDGGVMTAFPIITEATGEYKDVKTVSTGTPQYAGDRLYVNGNSFEEGIGVVRETGVAFLVQSKHLEAPEQVSSSWQRYSDYNGIGLPLKRFNSSIEIIEEGDMVYYVAAYVKTTSRYTFGEIKSIPGKSVPTLGSNVDVSIGSSGTSAMATVNVDSYAALRTDLIGSVVEVKRDGKVIEVLSNRSLAYFDGVYSQSNKTLKLYFDNLTEDSEYIIQLRVHNGLGWSNTIDFEINT